jgi:hypothetical protein
MVLTDGRPGTVNRGSITKPEEDERKQCAIMDRISGEKSCPVVPTLGNHLERGRKEFDLKTLEKQWFFSKLSHTNLDGVELWVAGLQFVC